MIRKDKLISLILLLVFLSSILTGCGDAMEVDDEVYAIVLGVDKGVNNKIRVTIQYPTYQSSGSGGGGGGGGGAGGQGGGSSNQAPGSNIHTIEASTILEALDMYGMAISRRVSLMHTKLMIFSEEFASEGVEKYMAPIARFRETRRQMNIVITKEKAQDFIKENKSNIGESLSKSIELMMNQSDNTSFFPRAIFQDFYKNLLSPYMQPYAIFSGLNDFKNLAPEEAGKEPPLVTDENFSPGELPREGVAKREYVGTAVFDGDKLVGNLNSQETRYFLMVTGKFKKGIISIEDKQKPGSAIPLDIRLGRKPIIKAYFKNGNPVIDVHLQIESDIGAIQSRIDYENLSKIEILNKQAEEHLTKGIINAINKTQQLNSDIFGFGHKLAWNFSTIQDWENYNWLNHYRDSKVNVTVSVNIRRSGLMMYSSPVKKRTNT